MKDIYQGGLYRILSEKEIYQIHETAIKILWEVGFEISYPPMLELLENNGATIDRENYRAYLPHELVSKCIKRAPAEFKFYGQEEGKEIILGGEKVNFGTGGEALYVMDTDRQRRPAVLQDIADFACLTDKLENVDFFIIPTVAQDVNINNLNINGYFQALRNTGKPVMGGIVDVESLRRVIELSSHLAGGMDKLRERPFVGFISTVASPLKIDDDRVEVLMEVAQHGLPLAVSSAPIAGATSPMTLAGTLVQQNAEALIGVVLSQLVNPGTPVLYSAVPCTMDMRYGSFLMGSIESGLMNAAVTQMAHHYRLPCYITVGVTDSKLPDAQAAYESATTCMLAALAGGNYIKQAFGFLDGAITISYAQFVIDNDIVGSCLRTLRGIDVNTNTLAFDVIADVGPGGNFLTQQHTVEHLRTEKYLPRVSSRQGYHAWLKAGEKDSWKNAEEIARKLIEESPKEHIPEDLGKELYSLFPELR